jgi:hypothetical protein
MKASQISALFANEAALTIVSANLNVSTLTRLSMPSGEPDRVSAIVNVKLPEL